MAHFVSATLRLEFDHVDVNVIHLEKSKSPRNPFDRDTVVVPIVNIVYCHEKVVSQQDSSSHLPMSPSIVRSSSHPPAHPSPTPLAHDRRGLGRPTRRRRFFPDLVPFLVIRRVFEFGRWE